MDFYSPRVKHAGCLSVHFITLLFNVTKFPLLFIQNKLSKLPSCFIEKYCITLSRVDFHECEVLWASGRKNESTKVWIVWDFAILGSNSTNPSYIRPLVHKTSYSLIFLVVKSSDQFQLVSFPTWNCYPCEVYCTKAVSI